MEIDNKDENPEIIKIHNTTALRYMVRDNGKNIEKEIPAYRQWYEKVVSESFEGENGIVCYCKNCRLFFYFDNLRRKNAFEHGNCNPSDFAEFCDNCGELYNKDSICCWKTGIKMFKRSLYDSLLGDCQDCCFMFPIISTIYFFSVFYHIITSMRLNIKKGKWNDINFKNEFITSDKLIIMIFIPLSLVYALVFFIHYMGLFYLLILIYQLVLRHRHKKNNQEHIFIY